MTSISRVRVAWTGFAGAPGVSTFYAINPIAFVPLLRDFLAGISTKLPSTVDLNIEPGGDVIEDTTGDLVGAWSEAALATVSGPTSTAYGAPAGACVNWLTQSIADGRRIRGRTFLVPLTGASFEVDGSLLPAVITQIKTAADALVAGSGPNFVVWHRPFLGAPATPTKAARPAHPGSSAAVTSSSVPDRVVVLTSRRD